MKCNDCKIVELIKEDIKDYLLLKCSDNEIDSILKELKQVFKPPYNAKDINEYIENEWISKIKRK